MASLLQRAPAFAPAGSSMGQSLLQPQRQARRGGGRGRGRGAGAPAAVAAAFADVRRARRPGLGTERYAALDQLNLHLDLGAAVDQLLPPPGTGRGRGWRGRAVAHGRGQCCDAALAALQSFGCAACQRAAGSASGICAARTAAGLGPGATPAACCGPHRRRPSLAAVSGAGAGAGSGRGSPTGGHPGDNDGCRLACCRTTP